MPNDLTPELRFPEFEDEYDVVKLEDITTWSSGGTPSKDVEEYWNGEIPWISASSMRGTEYSDSNRLCCMALNNSKMALNTT